MDNKVSSLSIALVHEAVINKRGEVIGSAVTNLDIHDIARAARTFGVQDYYLSTPYEDQHELVKELLAHWQQGYGATYNPARKEALDIVRLVRCVDEAIAFTAARQQRRPLVLVTSAQVRPDTIGYQEVRKKLEFRQPVLLLFGTAHGLAPEILAKADGALPPIKGMTDYNHLSVRSAAAIILDRLLGS